MSRRLPTALDQKDIAWRDYTAAKLLSKPIKHTAAVWFETMIEGWLYYDRSALVFIGDRAVQSHDGRAATNDDRVMVRTYGELGPGEVAEWFNRKERRIMFGEDALTFVVPKNYAKEIAKLSTHD